MNIESTQYTESTSTGLRRYLALGAHAISVMGTSLLAFRVLDRVPYNYGIYVLEVPLFLLFAFGLLGLLQGWLLRTYIGARAAWALSALIHLPIPYMIVDALFIDPPPRACIMPALF